MIRKNDVIFIIGFFLCSGLVAQDTHNNDLQEVVAQEILAQPGKLDVALKFIEYWKAKVKKTELMHQGYQKIFHQGTQFIIQSSAYLYIFFVAVILILSAFQLSRIIKTVGDFLFIITDLLGNNFFIRFVQWIASLDQQEPLLEVVCIDQDFLTRMLEKIGMHGFVQAVKRYPYWYSFRYGCYLVPAHFSMSDQVFRWDFW